jgi:hypothetical protein
MKEFDLSLPQLPPRVRTTLAWFTVVTSIAAVTLAGFAFNKVGSVAAQANDTAAISCVRTKTAAPYSTEDARERHVYPPEVQAWLEKSIPKSCPEVPTDQRPPVVTTPWPAPLGLRTP